jgi:hypothetical protein
VEAVGGEGEEKRKPQKRRGKKKKNRLLWKIFGLLEVFNGFKETREEKEEEEV